MRLSDSTVRFQTPVAFARLFHRGQAAIQTRAEAVPTVMIAAGMQQPVMRPIFRCRPDRVSGIPICRDSLPFAADSPLALFHDHDKPNFLFRPTVCLPSYLTGALSRMLNIPSIHHRGGSSTGSLGSDAAGVDSATAESRFDLLGVLRFLRIRMGPICSRAS